MIDETFLYLTTIGHKTGQQHRIEIWYVEHQSRYYVVSERRDEAHWVKNIRANPQVTFSIGTHDHPEKTIPLCQGQGRIILPEEHPDLVAEIRQAMQARYGWNNGLIVQLERT